MDAATLERLARGVALGSLGLSRREAFWAARGLKADEGGAAPGDAIAGKGRKGGKTGRGLEDLPLFAASRPEPSDDHQQNTSPLRVEPEVALPTAPTGEEVVDDFTSLRPSLRAHPVALLRPRLAERGWGTTEILGTARAGRRAPVRAGARPPTPRTAKGVIFITLEDEVGVANLIVWPPVFEAHRRVVLGAKLLGVVGRIQREGIVVHVVVEELVDLTCDLASPTDGTLDESGFAGAIANADEVRRTTRDHRAPDDDERGVAPKKAAVIQPPARRQSPSAPTPIHAPRSACGQPGFPLGAWGTGGLINLRRLNRSLGDDDQRRLAPPVASVLQHRRETGTARGRVAKPRSAAGPPPIAASSEIVTNRSASRFSASTARIDGSLQSSRPMFDTGPSARTGLPASLLALRQGAASGSTITISGCTDQRSRMATVTPAASPPTPP